MRSAVGYTNSLKSAVTSGLGFGVLMGAGQAAFSTISRSAVGLAKDTVSTSDAMQKLQQAMRFSGSSEAEIQRIAGATGTLKTYADKTVFALDDVMSTFGSLSANGIKDADKMTESVGNAVAVFGGGAQEFKSVGLAYSQAMASGALHAQDWNQILNASPQLAGGLRKELIRLNPALGEDFKGAMEKGAISADLLGQAMNNIGMTDLAKEAATSVTTFEGAMGNLEATAQSGMMKLYDTFAKSAVIDAINGLSDKVGAGFDWLATNIPAAIEKISPYWKVFKENAIEVKNAFGDAASAIIDEVGEITAAFGSPASVESFADVIGVASDALVTFAGFCEEHADVIAKVITLLPKLYVGYQGFKIVKTVAPFVGMFTSAIGGLVKMGLGKLAPNLFKVAGGQDAVGKSSVETSASITASAKAFMMMGAGVFLVSAGFYMLAQAAVSLAEAGPVAIGVMVGLVGAVAALGYGMVTAVNSMNGSAAKLKSIAAVFLAFGASVLMISMGFWVLSDAAIRLAGAGPAAIAVMAGMVVGLGALLIVAKLVAPARTAGAAGFLAFGAAVVLAGIGILLLTNAAISLAGAGPLAIAVMAGLVLAIAGLALGAAILGPALTAGAIGFIAFGAAIVLVGVGAVLAAAALMMVASVLPTLCAYGLQGAAAIMMLGAGMVVFAAGAAIAGAGCIVLGAGLAVVAIGLALVGAAVLITAAGVLVLAAGALLLGTGLTVAAAALLMTAASLPIVAAGAMAAGVALTLLLAGSVALAAALLLLMVPLLGLGAGFTVAAVGMAAFALAMTVGCAGVLAMSVALKAVNSSMKTIAKNARSAQASITSMVASVSIVNAGLDALGNKAKSTVNKIVNAFSGGAGKAQSAATTMMSGFNSGIMVGGNLAVATSRSMSNSIVSALRTAGSGAFSSGYNIGAGLASGMAASLGYVRSVAVQLAAAADEAIRAKARIHSPSRVSKEDGAYGGEGWIGGILSKVKESKKAVQELVNIPKYPEYPELDLALAGAGGMNLSDEYDYNSTVYVYAEVPVSIDGREVARASAPYTQEELSKRERRESRKKGRR